MELRTAELLLRPPADEDLPEVVAACRDPEIPRFIPLVPAPYGDQDALDWLEHVRAGWSDGSERTFSITRAADGAFLGVVALRAREGGTIGYWLAPAARGHGVMTVAVGAIVAWARAELGIRRLAITAHPDNTGSHRVAEKLGFVRTGTVRHEPAFQDGTTRAVRFELTA